MDLNDVRKSGASFSLVDGTLQAMSDDGSSGSGLDDSDDDDIDGGTGNGTTGGGTGHGGSSQGGGDEGSEDTGGTDGVFNPPAPLNITINGNNHETTKSNYTFVMTYAGTGITGGGLQQVSGPGGVQFDPFQIVGPGQFSIKVKNLVQGTYRFQAYLSNGVETVESEIDKLKVLPPPVINPGIENADMVVYLVSGGSGYVQNSSGQNIYGSPSNPKNNPHVWSLQNSGNQYGRIIRWAASPGKKYSPFVMESDKTYSEGSKTASKAGGTPTNPVIVYGDLGSSSGDRLTIIRRQSYGGSYTASIKGKSSNHKFNHIIFHNILWEASNSAAIHIGLAANPLNNIKYEGLEFYNNAIEGGFDWLNMQDITIDDGKPLSSKWGFFTYAVSNLKWVGGWIRNIRREHGFYMHNNLGDVTIEDIDIYHVGRTCVQITARECEDELKDETGFCPLLPPNPGKITLRNVRCADSGLKEDDGCEGGQALTIAGRNEGDILVEGCTVTQGLDTFQPGLHQSLINGHCPLNTKRPGGFVSWSASSDGYGKSGDLVMRNNAFLYQKDLKHSPGISASMVTSAVIRDNVVDAANGKTMTLGETYGLAGHQPPNVHCVRDNTLDGTLNEDFWLTDGDGGQSLVGQPNSSGMSCNP